jgi:type IV pilus assembly protein PilE
MTLVELMVVLSVLAITAAIVYPLYTTQVQKARRYDAQGVLFTLGNQLEQRRATQPNVGYTGFVLSDFSELSAQLNNHYSFSVNLSTLSYDLIATPVPGSSQAGDRCGTLSLNEVGEKAPVGNCWK